MTDTLLIVGGLAVAFMGVLAITMPTGLMMLALASFALAPEFVFRNIAGGVNDELTALHKGFLLFAVFANMLRYGVRFQMNWVIAALVAIVVLSKALGDTHEGLSNAQTLRTFIAFGMPWVMLHAVLERNTRWQYVLLICSIPLLSLLIGMLLQAAGLHSMFRAEFTGAMRLRGATIAPNLGLLAFVGFAVGLHESLRGISVKRITALTVLMAINLLILVLTGARMAMGACFVLAMVYLLTSGELRKAIGRRGLVVYVGCCLFAVMAVVFGESIYQRLFGGDTDEVINTSGRSEIWAGYFDEFMLSPLFGRGLGADAGSVLAATIGYAPHNEYLRILVDGGMVGFVIYFAAVAFTLRQVLRSVDRHDRRFLVALLWAFAVYAITDNILTMPPIHVFYGYLCVLLVSQKVPRKKPVAVADLSFRRRRRAAPEPGE